jgi:hypothetical protein
MLRWLAIASVIAAATSVAAATAAFASGRGHGSRAGYSPTTALRSGEAGSGLRTGAGTVSPRFDSHATSGWHQPGWGGTRNPGWGYSFGPNLGGLGH